MNTNVGSIAHIAAAPMNIGIVSITMKESVTFSTIRDSTPGGISWNHGVNNGKYRVLKKPLFRAYVSQGILMRHMLRIDDTKTPFIPQK
jgi:hypothetical protein